MLAERAPHKRPRFIIIVSIRKGIAYSGYAMGRTRRRTSQCVELLGELGSVQPQPGEDVSETMPSEGDGRAGRKLQTHGVQTRVPSHCVDGNVCHMLRRACTIHRRASARARSNTSSNILGAAKLGAHRPTPMCVSTKFAWYRPTWERRRPNSKCAWQESTRLRPKLA